MYSLSYVLSLSALTFGIAYLIFLISRKTQFSKLVWIVQIELAFFVMVMGVLNMINLFGVDTGTVFGIVGWIFLLAIVVTLTIFSTVIRRV
jgi:hypothetical protein